MDEPYTRPDEDPFSSNSLLQRRHERRAMHDRNSLLNSWINSPSDRLPLGSSSNPYLAYPDLPRQPVRHRTDSCSSYDLIDDDDIPHHPDPPKSPRSFISRSLFTPPRIKSRHSRSSSSPSVSLPPPRPSFSSSSSSSLSSPYLPTMSTATFDSFGLPDTPTKSRLSFFSSIRSRTPNASSTSLSYNPFGFSSSKDTLSLSPQRTSLSPRRPYPTHTLTNITDVDNDEDSNIDNLDFLPPPSNRFSHSSSASISSSHLSSSSRSHLPISKRERDKVYFSSLTRSGKKKRKLIVSGIGATEVRKLDGVKRWCETFGEIRSITRLPNGDLQIDFRDPDVAESVCRIRAKVFIAGVGSVQLSWIMGNKR